MHPVFAGKILRNHTTLVLGAALLAPCLVSCAQLGIATTDDLTAAENRLANQNVSTVQRLDSVEKSTSDMQSTVNRMATSVDSLNARFLRAKEWLEKMDIDHVSRDAVDASQAALAAQAQTEAFLTHYLDWIKAQYALLGQEIAEIEAKMKAAPPVKKAQGTPAPDKKSKDSGGDGK